MTEIPVALVTGGASGPGAAIVMHFARKGWGVALNYREAVKAEALRVELEREGAAARELAPRIQVNCLIPGQIDTPKVRARYNLERPEALKEVVSGIPMGRIGAVEDVTRMVDSILDAKFTTGANFFANGGDFMH